MYVYICAACPPHWRVTFQVSKQTRNCHIYIYILYIYTCIYVYIYIHVCITILSDVIRCNMHDALRRDGHETALLQVCCAKFCEPQECAAPSWQRNPPQGVVK